MRKILQITIALVVLCSSPLLAQPLSGTVNLPRFPFGPFTLSQALTQLNTFGVSGPTLIVCSSNETAPSGGFMLGCSSVLRNSLSSTNTLTINGSGRTFTAPIGSGSMDAIFTIQGMQYVTLRNFNFVESSSNTTATSMMERGISIVKCSKDLGNQKINVLNCQFTLNNTNTTASSGVAPNGSTAIFVGNCTALSTAALGLPVADTGTNDGIYVANSFIKNVNHGVYCNGVQAIADGTVFNDKNITLVEDTIENFTHHGVFLAYFNGDLVNRCRINNLSSGGTAPTSNHIYGIRYFNTPASFVTNSSWDCHNNNINLSINSSGTFSATGIFTQLNGTGSTFIEDDTIQLTSLGTSALLAGIFSQNNSGTQRIADNLLTNFATQTTNTQAVIGVFAGGYNTFTGLGASTIALYPTTSNVLGNRFDNWTVCSGTGAADRQVVACLDDNLTANTSNFTNNTVSNITLNNNCQQFMGYGGIWRYGVITLNRTTTVSGNTFNSIRASATTNTTPFVIINPAGPYPGGHTFSCVNNKLTSINSALGFLVGINVFDQRSALIDKDTMSDLTSDFWHVLGVVTGLNSANYATTTVTITNNSITNFKSNSPFGGAFVSAMQLQQPTPSQTTAFNISTNVVSGMSSTDTAGLAFGINATAGGTSATYSISNNMFSDIIADKDTSLFSSSYGINLQNSGTNNVYFNTVKLVSGTSSGKGYGATGLRYNPAATNRLQNNILHVNVVAGSLNNVSAMRSSAGAANAAPSVTGFTASSNIYYTPTGPNNYLYVDGTTNSTLANGYHEKGLTPSSTRNIVNDTFFNSECNRSSYHKFMQTGAATREVNTFTENNLPGTSGVYAPSGTSFAESRATDGPISVDFLAFPRPFGSSDIGALEFAGSTLPQMLISIVSSTGFDTACTFNLPSLTASVPPYFNRVSYQWFRDGTLMPGKTTRTTVVSPVTGDYTIQVYDSVTGCTYESDPFRITIVPPPPAQITYYDSLTFCETSAIVLNANKGYNYIYQWSRNGVNLSGETKDHIVVDKSGDYRVSVNTPLGCETTSGFVRVKVYPLPKPTVEYGGPGKLSTQKYFLYKWYKNNIPIDSYATNRDYYTLFTGDGAYSVEVTDSNGCTAKSDVYLFATRVDERIAQREIKLYPNPVQDVLQIESPIRLDVRLTDVTGRLVYTMPAAKTLQLGHLAEGMYLLSLYDQDGKLLKIEKINKVK